MGGEEQKRNREELKSSGTEDNAYKEENDIFSPAGVSALIEKGRSRATTFLLGAFLWYDDESS